MIGNPDTWCCRISSRACCTVSVGDSVVAHWAGTDAYYIGTAVEDKDDGFLVVFEDGDQAVVPKAKRAGKQRSLYMGEGAAN